MRLSKRLETVISFVETGSKVADVGTDHGYVPIALAKRGTVAQGLAMDVRTGPLERAKEHIRQHGLEDVIQVRLSDGVKELKEGEADTVIVAGMGGELVIHILEDGKRLWDEVKHWILSPQSDIDKVRKFLGENGFRIAQEEMIEEDGKYYTVMDVTPGRMERMEPWEVLYGPCLVRKGHPVLKEFLMKERGNLTGILRGLKGQEGESAKRREGELRQKAAWVEKALEVMAHV
ncbi:MAG: SAM-dependent methyltransferase [Hungatella sp.]|nr:SAM-dependent methyltransferase [Hungatella sp.]